MATVEKLMEALKAADAAGATEDAQKLAAMIQAKKQAVSEPAPAQSIDPSEPMPQKEDWSLLEDVAKPAWEDYSFQEDTVKPLGHILKGVPEGLAEMGDVPNLVGQGKKYVLEKAIGQENVQAIADLPGPLGYITGAQPIPALTPALEGNPIYEAVAGSSYGEGEKVPGWAETGRVGANWGGAGPINAVRKGTIKAATSDAVQAGGAMLGNVVDQIFGGDSSYGELTGGVVGVLASLRKGDFSKLTKEDKIAWRFLTDNIEEGRSIDELVDAVESRLANGEAGSLAELARDRGIQDIQGALAGSDSKYGRELQGLTEDRDAQILRGLTDEFVDFSDQTIPVVKDTGERALTQATARIEEGAAARAAETGTPIRADAEIDAAFDSAQAEHRLAKAVAEQQRVSGIMPPLRAQNTENTVSASKRESVFEGVDRADPQAMYAREKAFWADEAFNEVREHAEGFPITKEFVGDLANRLDNPEVRTSLTDFMTDALRRIAANKGMKPPKMGAEDFSYDDFLTELTDGRLDGNQMIALRSYFATNANKATNSIAPNTNRDIAQALDGVIKQELPDELAAQFVETKEVYAAHLANRDLMESPTTVLARGEYSPAAQVRAQSRYDYPGDVEGNVEAHIAAGASEAEMKVAKAEAKSADATLNAATKAAERAVKAETAALTAGSREVAGLGKTKLRDFSDSPVQTIQTLLSSKSAKATDELANLKRVMEDGGAGEEFNALIGESIVRTINDSKSGTAAKVLPKAVQDMGKYIDRLINSGIITDQAQADNLATIVERASVKEYLEGGKSAELYNVSLSEAQKLGSSAAAVVALRTLAPGSGSLIMANAFSRLFRRIVAGESGAAAVEHMRELTANPQRYVDVMKGAKSEKDALYLMLTEMVGAGQAKEILSEEN